MLRISSLPRATQAHILSGLRSPSRLSVEQQKGGGADTRGTLRGAASPVPPSAPPPSTPSTPNPESN